MCVLSVWTGPHDITIMPPWVDSSQGHCGLELGVWVLASGLWVLRPTFPLAVCARLNESLSPAVASGLNVLFIPLPQGNCGKQMNAIMERGLQGAHSESSRYI